MTENPEGGVAQESGGYDYKRLHSYPLIRYSDMNDEMRTEAMELCVTACEKFSANNEVCLHCSLRHSVCTCESSPCQQCFPGAAAKMIKESMDKKFGSSWHAVVGEGYGFELTHEVKNLLYMFFGGTVAVCVWKCS